ncbi:MAG TPA: hypothetical protein VMU95_26300 [Trebonia sp.]|nr:hypothetical protein [Trebonia sp.]
MTIIADEIREREARCQSYLARLRMAARQGSHAASPDLTAEVQAATSAILAEVEAVALVSGGQFLGARRARVVMAADDACRAALTGSLAELRGHVARLASLVSAIWVITRALAGNDTGEAPLLAS